MNASLLEQFTSHRLAGAAFEENIIGNHDCGAAALLQDREDVLEEA